MAQNNKNSVSKDSDVSINDLLLIADVASAIRQQREQVDKELNIDEKKADLRERILAMSKVTKEPLSEEYANIAVNNYLSGSYSFKEPKRDFRYKLASGYVDRARIGRRYGTPVLTIAVLSGLIWLTSSTIKTIHRRAVERGIEASVESAYQDKKQLENEISALLANEKKLQESDANEVRTIIGLSNNRLKSIDDFFDKFCSKGTASDDINQTNYGEAKQQLATANGVLITVRQDVEKGKGIVELQNSIFSTRQSLDSLIREIRNDKPPQLLADRAESAYQSGVVSLEKRQLSQGQKYRQDLAGIKDEVQQFAILPSQLEQLYSSIRSIAKESQAKEKGDKLYAEAQSYVKSVDVQQLRQAITGLKDLDAALKEEYAVKIVNRAGVKSGMDRYYTDERGRKVSGYYLIVEAIDSQGGVLQKRIKNEETDRVETVTMWGERVPDAVYESVKNDKIDNGIVENNVFAKKEKGYISEKIIMRNDGQLLQKAGQITSW